MLLNNLLVCKKCNSKDVDMLAWVNANTNIYSNESSESESGRYFCNTCNEHYENGLKIIKQKSKENKYDSN